MFSILPRNGYESLIFKAVDPRRSARVQKTHKVGLLILAALFSMATLGFGGFLIKKFYRVYLNYQNRLSLEKPRTFTLLVREETDLKKFPEIIATALQWELIASDIVRAKVSIGHNPESDQLTSSMAASRLIAKSLSDTDAFSLTQSRLFVCQDVALRAIWGLAIVRPMKAGPLELLYFVTHPNNLRISDNQAVSNKVKGAGRALIQHLKGVASGEIYLESYCSAVPFYEKMGFQRSRYLPDCPGLVPMEFVTKVTG